MKTKTAIKEKIFSIFKKIVKPFIGRGFNKFWLGRKIYNFSHSHLHPDTAIVHGNKMFLGDDRLKLSVNGMHEPFQTSLFKKIIKRGDTVLDIGAHIGKYTMQAAKLVGNNGKVVAIEADPKTFKALSEELRLMNLRM